MKFIEIELLDAMGNSPYDFFIIPIELIEEVYKEIGDNYGHICFAHRSRKISLETYERLKAILTEAEQ